MPDTSTIFYTVPHKDQPARAVSIDLYHQRHIQPYKWYLQKIRGRLQVVRREWLGGQWRIILLSRTVLALAQRNDNYVIGYKDGDALNCRSRNLYLTSDALGLFPKKSGGYIGVTFFNYEQKREGRISERKELEEEFYSESFLRFKENQLKYCKCIEKTGKVGIWKVRFNLAYIGGYRSEYAAAMAYAAARRQYYGENARNIPRKPKKHRKKIRRGLYKYRRRRNFYCP